MKIVTDVDERLRPFFHVDENGKQLDPPTLDEVEYAVADIIRELQRDERYLRRVRDALNQVPALYMGGDHNAMLMALARQEEIHSLRIQRFTTRARLAFGTFVRGDL